MAEVPSFFTRSPPKLKSMADVQAKLAERTHSTQGRDRSKPPVPPAASQSTAARTLSWLPPVVNPDGTGHQLAGGTMYQVRKTLTEGKLMFWAWHDRKLLGYSTDKQGARDFCQLHYEGS